MIDKVNRFCSLLVRVHSIIYFLVGMMIGLASHFLNETMLSIQHMLFLINIGLPIVFYALFQGLFCSIFYQEKYDEFQFRKEYWPSGHIGIPGTDLFFYSVIKTGKLNPFRKMCGYLYAFSKPIVLVLIGMATLSLFIVVNSRV